MGTFPRYGTIKTRESDVLGHTCFARVSPRKPRAYGERQEAPRLLNRKKDATRVCRTLRIEYSTRAGNYPDGRMALRSKTLHGPISSFFCVF